MQILMQVLVHLSTLLTVITVQKVTVTVFNVLSHLLSLWTHFACPVKITLWLLYKSRRISLEIDITVQLLVYIK